ncbi:MAG TPA: aminoglycoside phosphotransferase family protein [Natronosporangium sp.]
MSSAQRIIVPAALAASQVRHHGAAGRAWVAKLPKLATNFLERWQLRIDGPPAAGAVALVLPVRRADGTPAILKLQPVDEETAGEAAALRAWDGHGAVRLFEHDPATGTMLIERLDRTRSLSSIPDDTRAVRILSELLARLVSVPAPVGMRRLGEIAEQMLDQLPLALSRLPRVEDRLVVRTCATLMAEQLPVTEHQLLHWDLHYDNVLAGQREPWLAIDPKPLAGHPGFELLPALWNRWEELTITGNVARAVRRRFDLMVDILGLDPQPAAAWTLGRVLQNVLWDVQAGASTVDPVLDTIARALFGRAS